MGFQPKISPAERYENSRVAQTKHETELQDHRPQKDVNDEQICPTCQGIAAPCDVALRLMKKIQQCRAVRVAINNGDLR